MTPRSDSHPWVVVHAERLSLLNDLERLSPRQRDTPSLCPDWDVHDVLAHLIDNAVTTRLVEAFVHGEDIRRPLGMRGDYPPSHVAKALAYQVRTSVKMGGGKEFAAGFGLVASDAPFEHGEGHEVRGSVIALLLAVSGRPVPSSPKTCASGCYFLAVWRAALLAAFSRASNTVSSMGASTLARSRRWYSAASSWRSFSDPSAMSARRCSGP
jgi:hypothetical protein